MNMRSKHPFIILHAFFLCLIAYAEWQFIQTAFKSADKIQYNWYSYRILAIAAAFNIPVIGALLLFRRSWTDVLIVSLLFLIIAESIARIAPTTVAILYGALHLIWLGSSIIGGLRQSDSRKVR